MIIFLEIASFVLTGLLIFHSVRVRGVSFTLLFFITGGILGVLRENAVAILSNLYQYNPAMFTLWIGHAPIILMVFWSFTVYISMSLSERMVSGDLPNGRRVVPVIGLSMVCMGIYACFNEAMASSFPMILWKFHPDITVWGDTPIIVIFGYAGLAAIMLTILYLIHRRPWKTWVKVASGALSTIVMVPLHLAWIALTRLIIQVLHRVPV
ncbi:MAG: hypothetical protein JW885_16005 [Deltaproteobacteria bacterium]|nr:hypothetical protein [Candidatus Zymogenaceae bacterium]